MSVEELKDTQAAEAALSSTRQVLGARYELLGLLGSGGMGNVYRARDLELDELVALKVLRAELGAAPGVIERFRREVRLARRVTHPNVARVFDIGEHGGDRILTMELVEGESLGAQLAREGRPPLARTVQIALAVCAGVGAAHSAGVVHRDLKPDNVLVARDGRIVVTDFGIARAAVAEGSRTVGLVGTPAYMAPEQLDERVPMDHRVDVYAFGALLYELLTGQAAWQGESLWAIASARLLEPPPDPRARRAELPVFLAAVVLRCMAREVGERFGSMAEVAEALEAGALPSHATPAPSHGLRPSAERVLKSVAVLPFANLGTAEHEYVADGLTEDLIDVLSVAQGLRVRSRGTVMRFKGGARDVREVGRELDVQVVVEGSVRKGQGSYRVNARLLSVEDGFQLWARRFDVPEAELLVHNDLIARAVAEALTVDLAVPVREAAAEAGAVDRYLRAREAFHRAFTGNADAAIALFDEALSFSPGDARLQAGRAMAGAVALRWDPLTRGATLEASDKALALAPHSAEALAARGMFLFQDGDRPGAVEPLRRALRIAPHSAEAHQVLGRLLVEADHGLGVWHMETAIAREPTSEFPRINLAAYLALCGDYKAAYAVAEMPRDGGTYVMIPVHARLACWSRDRARAAALLVGLEPRSPVVAQAKQWLELVAHGKAMPPLPLPPMDMIAPPLRAFFAEMACEVACFTGDLDAALAALRRLDAVGGEHLAWFERCPLLEPLRAMPEAQPLRARIAERAARVIAAYESSEF